MKAVGYKATAGVEAPANGGAGPRKMTRPGCGEAARAFEARTGIKAPRIVAWEITRSCNLACAHCRAAAHREPYPGELSLDECKALIDDIASISDPILILTGGEPLMRDDIWDIVDYAHERGLHPVIGTNGTLIDQERATKIATHGIPRVSVSIDFPDATGQDSFRGKAGAFDEAITGIRRLREQGVGVQVNSTITKMNKDLLEDLHNLACDEGAVAFHPFLLVPTGRGEDLADVELSPDEYEEVLTWAYRRQKTSPLHFKPTDAPQYYRIARQMCAREGRTAMEETYGLEAATRGCLGGITFAFVSHVGDVQPCGYFDMQLGNIKEIPFSQIWESSPVFDDLRRFDRLRGKCGVCEYKAACGGCRARALAVTGDYLAEEPYCAHLPRGLRTRILDAIQSGFPLDHDPYGVLASQLGTTRSSVFNTVASLRTEGIARRIGASFNSGHLGYSSTLCALAATGEQAEVDRVAALISAHPEVTHNYLRESAANEQLAFNIWFTVIAPSTAAIECVISQIQRETGCAVLNLPATSVHKIKVDFGEKTGDAPAFSLATGVPFDAEDPFDIAVLKTVQADISDSLFPFEQLGLDEGRLLARLREWKADGTIRRFGAFVRHRKMGFAFNGMTVWDAPDQDSGQIGRSFAAFPFVSHCYERPRSQSWPFNLYAMVHARTQEELDARICLMRKECGLDCKVLVSLKEYKKTSPVYFV